MTKVIFRKFKDGGDIIALFPEDIWNRSTFEIASYMHIGQHGGAEYGHVIAMTHPARNDEYEELLAELVCIGYDDLRVMQKCRPRFI